MSNAQVASMLLSSIEPSIGLGLRGFSTAHAMWQHLVNLHTHVSTSRKFDIDLDLARLQQGELDIKSYYRAALQLWTEHDLISQSILSGEATTKVMKERASSLLMTFLMKLNPSFESVRASLLPSPISNSSTRWTQKKRGKKQYLVALSVPLRWPCN
ncbi:unnamed protein product [Linum trigynum]|uniref:Retrotransposon gag domain-containing protein n=1 Tax=Linum trigynum TaxID=586398 RepID=A0AAV2G4Y7_9ROSI